MSHIFFQASFFTPMLTWYDFHSFGCVVHITKMFIKSVYKIKIAEMRIRNNQDKLFVNPEAGKLEIPIVYSIEMEEGIQTFEN